MGGFESETSNRESDALSAIFQQLPFFICGDSVCIGLPSISLALFYWYVSK